MDKQKVLKPIVANIPSLANRSNFDLSAIVWRLWRPIADSGIYNGKKNDSSTRVVHRLWFYEADSTKSAKELSSMKDVILAQIKDNDVLIATFQKADLEKRVNTTREVTPQNKVILYSHAKIKVTGKEVKNRLAAILPIDGYTSNLKDTNLKDTNYLEKWEHERAKSKGGSKQKTTINFGEA